MNELILSRFDDASRVGTVKIEKSQSNIDTPEKARANLRLAAKVGLTGGIDLTDLDLDDAVALLCG